MLTLLLTRALADDELALPSSPVSDVSVGYSGSLLLPDARHRAAGEVEVGVGAGGALLEVQEMCLQSSRGSSSCSSGSFEPAGLPTFRVAWTPGANLRLETNVGVVVEGGAIGTAALSWSAPVGNVLRLGAFAGVVGLAYSDFPSADGVVAGGATLSARWSRVAFDVSVPLFAVNGQQNAPPFYLALAASEASVSVSLGGGHSFHAGMASLAPGVGWQYDGGHFLARAELHSLGVVTAGRAEVGARF